MRKTQMPSVMLMAIAALVLVVVTGVAPHAQNKPELALKAAMDKEVVDGDLKAAIEMYRQIAKGSDRAVAARALIRMGQCYEKLGDAQARATYEQVVRDFGDQKEAVAQARALLSASGRPGSTETGLAFQRKWVLPPTIYVGGLSRRPSPDGRYMYFRTNPEGCLWQHDLTTGEDRRLLPGQPCRSTGATPEVSPDGRQIAYTRLFTKGDVHTYELWVAGLNGSGAKLVMSDRERRVSPKGWFSPKGWSPDAKYILLAVYSAMGPVHDVTLALVSTTDGSVRSVGAEHDYSFGSFSPDGKYLIAYRFTKAADGSIETAPGRLKLIPVDGSGEIVIFEGPAKTSSPLWTPDGRMIVFISDRSGTTDLWGLRMSGARPEGEPELLKREIGPISLLGFTRDGSLYYAAYATQSNVYTADLDPATGRILSKPTRVSQRFVGSVGWPVSWSPDGQALVYSRISGNYNPRKVTSLVVRSERTGEEREIVPVPAFTQRYPFTLLWHPDGRSLLVDNVAKERSLHQIDLQSGQTKAFLALGSSNDKVYYPVLSPDAKALFYVEYDAVGTCRLMRRDLEGGGVRELHQTKGLDLEYVALSADGRHLAFEVSDWNSPTNTFSLMIMPAEGGEVRERLKSKQYIDHLAWMRDGRYILMTRDSESGPAQLWSVPTAGGEPQQSGLAIQGLYHVSVHPDGRRIAFSSGTGPVSEIWAIKNLPSAPATPRK